MENIVLYDFPVGETQKRFTQSIAQVCGGQWTSAGHERVENKKIHKQIIGLKFTLKVFLSRKKYNHIIFWQQMYGLYFLCLCRFFHVKKINTTTVLTLIYKEKNGVAGKVWRRFFDYALTSKYVDKIIVYSEHECNYLRQKFNINPDKISWTNFGMPDESMNYSISTNKPDKNGYLLDVGRSNRDHDFTINSLKTSNHNVHIVDFYYQGESVGNCKVIRDITFGRELYEEIANCFALVVPLNNRDISAGQTVFIQAMMFGKPIIVTESNTISEYVQDHVNGLVIKKTPEELQNTVAELVNDEKLYRNLSENAKRIFKEKFTREKMGLSIGEIIMQIDNDNAR